MMPHAIRRVYVARRARTAASITIALLGAALLVTASLPSLARFLASGLPGINPAVLCTLLVAMWIVGGFVYAAARALDEHRFAVAMSRFVMPGKDVIEDVERLSHEHPDRAAREMAHRLEVRSAALPVLAAGVLLPVTALYASAFVRAGGWPVIADFEASIAANATELSWCALAGVVASVVMTKRFARLPANAPFAVGIAIVSLGIAFATTMWLVAPALIAAAAALVVRRLRIERDLLQAEDPAAGSEIFTIRGLLRQLRASGASVVCALRATRRRRMALTVTCTAVAAGAIVFVYSSPQEPMIIVTKPEITYTPSQPTVTATGSTYRVEPIGDGQLRVTFEIADTQPVTLQNLAGLDRVPHGWNARVSITLIEGETMRVTPFADEPHDAIQHGQPLERSQASCALEAPPMKLSVAATPGRYVLLVAPVLEPAGC